MDRRQIAGSVGTTLLGSGGLGLLAAWSTTSSASVILEVAGIALALIGSVTLIWLWFTPPKEAVPMSGSGPKNVNFGTNSGIIGDVSVGKVPFNLTEDWVRQILLACPRGIPVVVIATGSARAFPMQAAIMAALSAAGYSVTPDSIMMPMPPPTQALSVNATPTRTYVTIAPDA